MGLRVLEVSIEEKDNDLPYVYNGEDQESYFAHTIISTFVFYKSNERNSMTVKRYVTSIAHQSPKNQV